MKQSVGGLPQTYKAQGREGELPFSDAHCGRSGGGLLRLSQNSLCLGGIGRSGSSKSSGEGGVEKQM